MRIARRLLCTIACLSLLVGALPAMAASDDAVYFRGNTASFNSRYFARITHGGIEVREKEEGATWIPLTLPQGLSGQVTELAMDDEHIIALNGERQVYTMWNGLDEIDDFKWQVEWGIPFWRGPGLKLRDDILKWDFSVVSRREDGYWTDPAGNRFKVGAGKCSHIWMLHPDQMQLMYNDPWLPRDYSYGTCGPARGGFQAVNLSTSGSFLFVMNTFGDMYTRLYDFDIAGSDFLFPASWEDQSNALIPKIQIPAPWVKHPKIDGTITTRISIHKVGRNGIHRTLRVEGCQGEKTGYFEKDITERTGPEDWVFVETGRPLKGAPVSNTLEDKTQETIGDREDLYYSRNMESVEGLGKRVPWYRVIGKKDWAAELTNFSAYNSPVELIIHLSKDEQLKLNLHTRDTLRVAETPRGISFTNRYIPGCIEIPEETLEGFDDLKQKSRKFIQSYLMKRRFTNVDINASLNKVTVSGTAGGQVIVWAFTP